MECCNQILFVGISIGVDILEYINSFIVEIMIQKWSKQIDETTRDFNNLFGLLTAAELNWKPAANTWSIAQNVEHLIVINQSYFPIINSVRDSTYKTPFISRFGFVADLIGKKILDSVQVDQKRKVTTFPIWEPTQSDISEDILDRFGIHQSELKEYIENAQDMIEKGTVISSPANKYIVYKLETAFDIIVTHERRHLEQARGVLELLGQG